MFERIQNWLEGLPAFAVLLWSGCALALVGVGDYLTGTEIIFTMFYLIPVSAVSWRMGRSAGIVASFVCAVVWSAVDFFGRPVVDPATEAWNIAIQCAMFISYAVVLSSVRKGIDGQRVVNADLEDALAEVKRLSGVLPICAWCKKIRDTEGVWHQLEAYLVGHSDVDFTHSICPECKAEHFPGRGRTHAAP